jgi:hypothetical protein
LPLRSSVVRAVFVLGVLLGGFCLVSVVGLRDADSWSSVASGMSSVILLLTAVADWRSRQSGPVGDDVVAPDTVTVQSDPPASPHSSAPVPSPGLLGGLPARFAQAYEWHGVARAEIPDFLSAFGGPSMTLSDLGTDERLLDRLDAPLLDFTTAVFDLHQDWLRREDANQVLRAHNFYKSVNSFPDFLLVQSVSRSGRDRLWNSGFGASSARLTMLSTSEPVLPDHQGTAEPTGPYVGAIYQVQIGTFRGRPVWRYHPLVPFNWGYWRTRYQLVAMMAIADECRVTVLGQFVDSKEEVFDLCQGRRFPREVTPRLSPTDWWPKYPYLGSHARQNDPTYLRTWTPYLEYIKEEGYREALAEAWEERRRVLRCQSPEEA